MFKSSDITKHNRSSSFFNGGQPWWSSSFVDLWNYTASFLIVEATSFMTVAFLHHFSTAITEMCNWNSVAVRRNVFSFILSRNFRQLRKKKLLKNSWRSTSMWRTRMRRKSGNWMRKSEKGQNCCLRREVWNRRWMTCFDIALPSKEVSFPWPTSYPK